MSKEHLFGEWLKRYFPRNAETSHVSTYASWSEHFVTPEPHKKIAKRQGHIGSKKLRFVCQTCNNGWLSDLEEWAMKALPPLFSGNKANLLPGGQQRLAAWVAKTAVVAEFLQPDDDTVPEFERRWLYEHKEPPSNWVISIASYSGEKWRNLGIYKNRGRISDKPVFSSRDAPHFVQATTFGMGKILFNAISSDAPGVKPALLEGGIDGMVRIWPNEPQCSIVWPMYEVMDDERAGEVANILNMPQFFDHTYDEARGWSYDPDDGSS